MPGLVRRSACNTRSGALSVLSSGYWETTLQIQSADSLVAQRLTKRTRTARSCRPSVMSQRAGCRSRSEFVRSQVTSQRSAWRWPMTREEFRAKWSTRRAEWEKLGVLIAGAKICDEFIPDFENVLTSHDEAVLNTTQAPPI